MRISSLDIGTNTILLLVAEVDSKGGLNVLRDEHAFARLGRNVDRDRTIAAESFETSLAILARFKEVSENMHVERIVACGTSALRDAANRTEYLEYIRKQLGLDIRILSGDEEAALTYAGSVAQFVIPDRVQEFAVLDIGGGSTELTRGVNTQLETRQSLDVGCVRLTERILLTSPPSHDALQHAQREIREYVKQFALLGPTARVVGVAGTLTTLAALHLKLATFDASRVGGHVLNRAAIQNIFDELKVKSLVNLESYPQILKGRADIILAGVLILLETMNQLQTSSITVSERGLRFGVLLEAVNQLTSGT